MRSHRRARLALATLVSVSAWASACASTGHLQTKDAPQNGAANAPISGPIVQAAPVAASGPPITSEEDADHQRRELDTLANNDPQRLGRRQALVDFYVMSARAALERKQPDDAYSAFEAALSLFEARELQDPRQPPSANGLFEVAREIDRTFSRRGAHPQVVTAMMVQMSLRPGDGELRRRYGELRDWLNAQSEGVRNLLRGRGGSLQDLLAAPPPTLLSDLEQTYRVWPAAPVQSELLALYRTEAINSASGKKTPKDFLQSLSSSMRRKGLSNSIGFKIARVYLRASRPKDAVDAIKQLGQVARLSAEDLKLQEVLEETLVKPVFGADDGERFIPAVKLAMTLAQNPEDAEVSLQICSDLAVRAPKLVAAHMCIGELALALERKGLALRAFERARSLAPNERGVWDMVGRLYVDRLSDLVVDERTAELEQALTEVEAFYQGMRQRFPDHPPTAGIAVALAEVGRGYYNAGRIEEAVRYLERSVSVEPNAVALEQLGILQMRRGKSEQAAATLERARAVFMSNQQAEPAVRMLFYARMGRLISEALTAQRNPEAQRQAAEMREKTLRQFEQLIDSNRLSASRGAEAEIERGRLLYNNGEREQALEAFRRAADLNPGEEQGKGQGQVYVDILAFLVPHGEVDEALSMYHRALGRVRLPDNMKVYASLWVSDLLARSGQPADPQADGALLGVQSGKWPADLALWASGRLGVEDLLSRADTPGKRAEANFYLAMARLRAGDQVQAEAGWRRVIDTQMLGYFEYEMSAQYLQRKGAPVAPTAPSSPPPRMPKSAPPPAGSI